MTTINQGVEPLTKPVSIDGFNSSARTGYGAATSCPTIAIREARLRDCDSLAEIYGDAVVSGHKTMDTEMLPPTYFEKLLRGKTPRESVLVAQAGVRVVGWSKTKQYSRRGGYRFTCETSVYVADSHQNRGYGSALLRAIINRSHSMQYRHVVAKILAFNTGSIRLHQRFGFSIVGRQNAVGYLEGAWQDVIIMQRVLTNADLETAMA